MKPQYKINRFIPDPDTHKDRWQVYDIKEGGMGWVYIVYDHEWKEPLAVKTYKDMFLQTEVAKEQFKKEAFIWINLNGHENITQAKLIDEIDNRIYIFLEYIAGGDLSCKIGTKELNINQILKFALQFCYGMEHAVTHGIVCHRDIKPGNCLIAENNTLKITDFGLAKSLDSDIIRSGQSFIKNEACMDKTKTGETCGTPFYMAPEQFDDIKHLDIRSDIYSFGVMLYEMISGKLPFYGSTFHELKEAHQKKAIPDISSQLNRNERSLADILYKCIEKHPHKRYNNFNTLLKVFIKLYKLLYSENPPLPEKGKKLQSLDFNNKGVALSNLKFYSTAIECYDKAIQIDPRSEYWNNKGIALVNLNFYQDGIECYNKAINLDSTFHGPWYNKGIALGKSNRYQEAIECYNKAIEINPDFIPAWCYKSTALMNLKRYQEAIVCLEKAGGIDPEHPDVWNNKGNILNELNYHKEAIDCFNKALEIDPQYLKAWFNKGIAYANLNSPIEVIKCFDIYLKDKPDNCEAWYNKGVALGNLNRNQEAIDCYAITLEINPDYTSAWFNRGAALLNINKTVEALECFIKARDQGHHRASQAIIYCKQQLLLKEE